MIISGVIDTPDTFGDEPGMGWFEIAGVQRGHRQLSTQLEGLEELIAEAGAGGLTVLDLGCAEGLVGFEFLARGAALLTGVELVGTRLNTGLRLAAEAGMSGKVVFRLADLSDMAVFDSLAAHDVVLALSIARKMPAPDRWLLKASALARKYFVLRSEPVIEDRRSEFRTIDTDEVLRADFKLLRRAKTSLETMSIFARKQ